MLQNTRVTAFTVSELIRVNQQRGERGCKITTPLRTQIRVNINFSSNTICGSKPWKKWTNVYWFAHIISKSQGIFGIHSGVIPAVYEVFWKVLSGSEIRLVSISYTFPHISLFVSLCFTCCFPNFFGYFPFCAWCFFLFPV